MRDYTLFMQEILQRVKEKLPMGFDVRIEDYTIFVLSKGDVTYHEIDMAEILPQLIDNEESNNWIKNMVASVCRTMANLPKLLLARVEEKIAPNFIEVEDALLRSVSDFNTAFVFPVYMNGTKVYETYVTKRMLQLTNVTTKQLFQAAKQNNSHIPYMLYPLYGDSEKTFTTPMMNAEEAKKVKDWMVAAEGNDATRGPEFLLSTENLRKVADMVEDDLYVSFYGDRYLICSPVRYRTPDTMLLHQALTSGQVENIFTTTIYYYNRTTKELSIAKEYNYEAVRD